MNMKARKRAEEAVERQSERELRTPEEQIKKLDTLLGFGKGALKERARLNKQILKKIEENKVAK